MMQNGSVGERMEQAELSGHSYDFAFTKRRHFQRHKSHEITSKCTIQKQSSKDITSECQW